MPDKRVISGGSFMPFLRIKNGEANNTIGTHLNEIQDDFQLGNETDKHHKTFYEIHQIKKPHKHHYTDHYDGDNRR